MRGIEAHPPGPLPAHGATPGVRFVSTSRYTVVERAGRILGEE